MKMGSTWYDYQHNGTMGRMIDQGADRRLHLVWMQKPDGTPGIENQRIFYNTVAWYDSTVGPETSYEWITYFDTSGIQVTGETPMGFTNVQVWNQRAIPAWHQGPVEPAYSPRIGIDFCSGCGAFFVRETPLTNCEGIVTQGIEKNYYWPKHAVLQDVASEDRVIHIVSVEFDNDNMYKSMVYYRGVDDPPNFGTCAYFVDSVTTANPVVVCDTNGRVAIVYMEPRANFPGVTENAPHKYNNDVVYVENDNPGADPVSSWALTNVTNYQY
jgi:hypothetical protein